MSFQRDREWQRCKPWLKLSHQSGNVHNGAKKHHHVKGRCPSWVTDQRTLWRRAPEPRTPHPQSWFHMRIVRDLGHYVLIFSQGGSWIQALKLAGWVTFWASLSLSRPTHFPGSSSSSKENERSWGLPWLTLGERNLLSYVLNVLHRGELRKFSDTRVSYSIKALASLLASSSWTPGINDASKSRNTQEPNHRIYSCMHTHTHTLTQLCLLDTNSRHYVNSSWSS